MKAIEGFDSPTGENEMPDALERVLVNSVHVCFAPKATEILRCREMTRCANHVVMRRSKKYGYSISSSAWPNTVGDMSRVYPGIDLLGAAMKEALQSTLIFVLWVVFWLAGTISGAVLQAWLINIGVVSDIDPPWIITIGSSFIGFFAGAYAAVKLGNLALRKNNRFGSKS
jgi:hypothetical protein